MALFLLVFFFIVSVSAYQHCQTPTQQPGKCVLINHCPHLFATILQNSTKEDSKKHVKNSYCGTESLFFPKVCCPLEAIEVFEESGVISHNKHASKCGLHAPDGPSDPWLALLDYENGRGENEFLCAGVLINKRYVLTAAHCITGPNLSKNSTILNVRFGEKTSENSEQLIIPVADTTVHEDYDPDDPNRYNDIALVRLKNKVNFKQEFVRPICMMMDGKKNFVGKPLQVTGWGKSGNFSKKLDGIATVWDNSECNSAYNVRLRDSQMCAGGRKLLYRYPSKMDIGGVLMNVGTDTSYGLVGIMSMRDKERENEPKVYTKVASYMDWIMGNLKS